MQQINSQNFTDTINSNKVVVVDFSATWCAPCKMLHSVLEKAAQEMPEVKFVKVDVDESPALAEEFEISNVPCLIVFVDQQKVDRLVGLVSKDNLIQFVKRCMGQ